METDANPSKVALCIDRVWKWVRFWGPPLGATAATGYIAVVGIDYVHKSPIDRWLIGGAFLLSVVLAYFAQHNSWKMNKKLNQLEQIKNQSERLYGTVESAINSVVENLGETSGLFKKDACRISLYCHDDNSNEFILLSRRADHTTHEEKGRLRYPDNEGHIGYAWNHKGGLSQYVDWPEDKDEWVDHATGDDGTFSRDKHLKRPVAEQIKFKARSGYYRRIEYNNKPIGLVVVESLKARGVTSTVANQMEKSSLWMILGQIIFLSKRDFLSRNANDD